VSSHSVHPLGSSDVGSATLAGFSFIAAPAITSFTPLTGGAGTTITITGTNLNGATAVSFGGTAAASFVVNSNTSITATVASGTSGDVVVTTPAGSATLAGFSFISNPVTYSKEIRLYPNPSNGNFVLDTLNLSDQWEVLDIFDSDGKKKLTSIDVRNRTIVNVNVSHLANGFYAAVLRRKSGPSRKIKFLLLR
jgi:hypothetical protein